MYLEPELIERLNEVALRFNRGSKQLVVAEIVSLYLPTWVAVNTSMTRAVELQVQNLINESARSVNGRTKLVRVRHEGELTDEIQTRNAGSKTATGSRRKFKAAK